MLHILAQVKHVVKRAILVLQGIVVLKHHRKPRLYSLKRKMAQQ
jgi:hypothetical protein